MKWNRIVLWSCVAFFGGGGRLTRSPSSKAALPAVR